MGAVQTAARTLGLEVVRLEVRRADEIVRLKLGNCLTREFEPLAGEIGF